MYGNARNNKGKLEMNKLNLVNVLFLLNIMADTQQML